MSSKVVLVPTDFTKVAEVAMEHAIKTAEVIGGKVVILHVVAKAKDVDDAKAKLQKQMEMATKLNPTIKAESIVRIGNIFDDIGDTAAELGAELIFMGTHGAKGWQKITGSHALKVILNSETPFIVVQERGIKGSGYDNIIVPMDLHKDTKQKLLIVSNIATVFNSKVHLIVPHESDEFLKNQLDRNIHFAKQYLGEREISFSTRIAENSAFEAAILSLGKEIDADLVAIMNHAGEDSILGLLGRNTAEQQLMTNDQQIPVMIINPKQVGRSGSILFS
jgi:nucleotide-binding universal stress UspA family protein